MFDVYFYGPLRVLIDQDTGAVLAVQDRVSGCAAALRYSPEYIARAIAHARMAHEALAD